MMGSHIRDQLERSEPEPSTGRGTRSEAALPGIPVTYAVLLLTVPGMVLVDSSIGLLRGGAAGSALSLSPGQLVRGGLFAAGLASLPLIGRRGFAGVRVTFVALFFLGLISIVTGWLLRPASPDLVFDLHQLFRVLFGPIFVLLLAAVFSRFGVRLRSMLSAMAWFGALSAILILILNVAGVGLRTYGEYSEAFAGFFAAPNDTGVGMLLGLAGSFYLFLRHRGWIHGVTSLLTASGLLVLGTRAAVFGVILVPGYLLLANAGSAFSRRRWLSSLGITIVCLVGLIGLVQYQQSRLQRDEYQASRLAELAAADFGRVYLAARALSYIGERPFVANLLGEGADAYRRGGAGRRTETNDLLAEVDWVDLIGAHGVPFTLLLYGFYLHFFFRDAWRDRVEDPQVRSVLVVALLVYVGHASVAGHAITSPTPSGVIAPILAYVLVTGRRRFDPIPLSQKEGEPKSPVRHTVGGSTPKDPEAG